ncbi:hypothetical protein PR202_gb17661 [Eleusine coracana subsp. coracana]|uniref:TMEM205-like domain-containing protein n=1 Tax=Eleusine coracana subsp. coracana TaxID=191504 RepID=A0AAV5F3A8_ELECO|nr:hypothetical protein PR202_gb17661 [Eleusine coracana subsp. coracana]
MGWAARFLTAVSFLAAGVLFAPDAVLGGRSGGAVAAAKLAHLLSLATAWGAGLWVTFIGGSIMSNRASSSRDTLRHRTLPSLFGIDLAAAATSLAAFAYLHPWKTSSTIEGYQLGFLIVALGCDLSNLLVFTPMAMKVMMKKYKMEKDLGIGTEVGFSRNLELAKTNPALAAMNWKFRMIHGFSSLVSAISFGSLAIHSWYLASKLDL